MEEIKVDDNVSITELDQDSISGGRAFVYLSDRILKFYDSHDWIDADFILMNMRGQELQKGTVTEGLELDMRNYAKGVYIFCANRNGFVKSQRIILQ